MCNKLLEKFTIECTIERFNLHIKEFNCKERNRLKIISESQYGFTTYSKLLLLITRQLVKMYIYEKVEIICSVLYI